MSEATELADRLRQLSDDMLAVSQRMDKFCRVSWDGEILDHAKELKGAAEKVSDWASGIRAVYVLEGPTDDDE